MSARILNAIARSGGILNREGTGMPPLQISISELESITIQNGREIFLCPWT